MAGARRRRADGARRLRALYVTFLSFSHYVSRLFYSGYFRAHVSGARANPATSRALILTIGRGMFFPPAGSGVAQGSFLFEECSTPQNQGSVYT